MAGGQTLTGEKVLRGTLKTLSFCQSCNNRQQWYPPAMRRRQDKSSERTGHPPREKITAWRREYNQERPHNSPGYRTPQEFARHAGGENGCGKGGGFAPLENAARFPLSHSHGGDDLNHSDVVL